MSRTLQLKRYANTVVANTTGAVGELIVDLTNKTLTVHDGITVGGSRLTTETYVLNTVNVTSVLAQSAFTQANSSNVLAQSAFTQANSAFGKANNAGTIIPQNAQNTDYTLISTDAGKHLYYTQSANVNLYIPWSSNASFSNGTTITIVSRTSSAANVTITPNVGVSLYLAGNTTSASRNLITYGIASLLQVEANTWMIYGNGVT
jgi:hypothetical protein